eukprot:1335326-Ditylum_brightwellii.AAC.1
MVSPFGYEDELTGDGLEFQVYQKENQLLKYIDEQITHYPSTFSSIMAGVLIQLCRLMSQNSGLEGTQVDEIYPAHAEAPGKTCLAPDIYLAFREIWEKDDGRLAEKKKKQHDSKNTFF